MQTNTDIETVFARIHFFLPEDRDLIHSAVMALPAAGQQQLLTLLLEAERKQRELLAKAIEVDPSLPNKIHTFLQEQMVQTQGNLQQQDASQAQSALDSTL